jgi:hypothetical protein
MTQVFKRGLTDATRLELCQEKVRFAESKSHGLLLRMLKEFD